MLARSKEGVVIINLSNEMNPTFETNKEKLFAILLSDDYQEKFLVITAQLRKQGKSEKEIYEVFLEFHRAIQIDPRTNAKESYYDKLSDFMDGFTSWGNFSN